MQGAGHAAAIVEVHHKDYPRHLEIEMIRPILRFLTRHVLSAFILAALLAAPLVILHTLDGKAGGGSGLVMELR
ncbi:hypothetical protein AMK06_CH02724 [Rhizobium sp. N541]|nr:hypothetical protein AMK06_CH02724 [Rhizobium sp. N541]ANM23997.1 hypothetical protein AMK07_CH02721 [Rhizobium sp. N941]